MQTNALRNKNRIYEGQVLYLRPQAAALLQEEQQKPVPAQVGRAKVAPVVATESVQIVEQVAEVESPAVIEESVSVVEDETGGVEAVTARDVSEEMFAPSGESVQAALVDPNDYSVAGNGTIEVQAAETLGHYADWLEIRTQRLRDINAMSFSKPVVVGRRVELVFSRVSAEEFTNRRILYHRDMQEAFFTNYRVVDTTEHKLKRGESVWILTLRNYKIPVWLLRQYNPDLDFGAVRPGMRIVFPRIEPVEQEARNLESVADAS
jgi:membrane-bound lytic murein transglycosylase D